MMTSSGRPRRDTCGAATSRFLEDAQDELKSGRVSVSCHARRRRAGGASRHTGSLSSAQCTLARRFWLAGFTPVPFSAQPPFVFYPEQLTRGVPRRCCQPSRPATGASPCYRGPCAWSSAPHSAAPRSPSDTSPLRLLSCACSSPPPATAEVCGRRLAAPERRGPAPHSLFTRRRGPPPPPALGPLPLFRSTSTRHSCGGRGVWPSHHSTRPHLVP